MCINNGSFYFNSQCFKLGLTLVRPISKKSKITRDFAAQSSMFAYIRFHMC